MASDTQTSGTARAAAIAILVASLFLLGALAVSTGTTRPRPRAMPVEAAPAARSPIPASRSAPIETGYVVKRVLDIPTPFVAGQYYWDEAGAPPGPIVVTVDLKAQTLSVFRAGYEIGTAVITYGADDYPTPLGVFQVTQKDAHHVSNLYGAPMPYMLRLTNDGVSIHGAKVSFDYATHGCVGVPTAFAKLLFDVVKPGDRVIVTRGEMLSRGDKIKAA